MSLKVIILVNKFHELYRIINAALRSILTKRKDCLIEFRLARVESVMGIFGDNVCFIVLEEPPEDVMSIIMQYEIDKIGNFY